MVVNLDPMQNKGTTHNELHKEESKSHSAHNKNYIYNLYIFCEKDHAKSLREATMFLGDHVYVRVADLDTNEKMFSADIYYHVNYFTNYIQKIKTANASSVVMNK